MKTVIWVVGIVVLLVVVGGAYFISFGDNSSGRDWVPEESTQPHDGGNSMVVWSAILELSKNGETKTLESYEYNFVFSEDPYLSVRFENSEGDTDSRATFVVITGGYGGDGEFREGLFSTSEPFSINVGEEYYYEPEGLTIKFVGYPVVDCPEGQIC